MNPNDAVEAMAAELKAAHGPIAGVPYRDGGLAFFRRPTPEEYDNFAMYADEPDARRKAHRAYVRGCFVKALDGSTLEQVEAKAGPVWLTGPAGNAVNTLAGAKEVAPTRFF
jgi:hypothetical protein